MRRPRRWVIPTQKVWPGDDSGGVSRKGDDMIDLEPYADLFRKSVIVVAGHGAQQTASVPPPGCVENSAPRNALCSTSACIPLLLFLKKCRAAAAASLAGTQDARAAVALEAD